MTLPFKALNELVFGQQLVLLNMPRTSLNYYAIATFFCELLEFGVF